MKFPKIEWAAYRDRLLGALFDAPSDAAVPPTADPSASSSPHPVPTSAERAARDREVERVLIARSRTAAGLGALPVVDIVAVIALQARMLREIARIHDMRWTPDMARDLLGRLGPGIAGGMLGQTLGRSALKFVPLVGQSVGAAWSARSASASTYALGRAADWYLARRAGGEVIDTTELRSVHRAAGARARELFSGNDESAS
ncbi:DUF697 domain-containing protein [Pseudazoarcus pumilus]|uniref:DUF697 domain-containing protein n=1 Tax=Pseudazoarcus pumilus TaxID=2067960 RepID=UPI0013DBF0ED|nr:DUF697 domain-containing protein [Pseudazoarcus pumilus]